MASIDRRGGKFRVRWREAGRERSRTCETLKAARALKKQVEFTTDIGESWKAEFEAEARVSLIAAVQSYLDDRARLLAANTMKSKKCALGLFLDFMDDEHSLDPQSMSRAALVEFHGYMLSVRQTTMLTANQRTRIVKVFWDWAYDHDVIGSDFPRPRRVDLPRAHAELEPYAPSWEQMDRAILQAPGWAGYALTVLRFTGLRGEQALGLRWDDLDMDRGVLRIRPELGKTAKESRGRWVPVSPHLLEILASPTWPKDPEFIIKAGGPKRKISYPHLRQAWAGIQIDRVQPRHACRRGFAAGLAQAGCSTERIAMLIGHSTTITTDTYIGAVALMPLLREAVALVPPMTDFADRVVPLRS